MADAVDLASLAARLELTAAGDVDLLELARGLRVAATSARPVAAIARSLRLPVNRRSPARVARDDAFARMADCERYRSLKGKRLYEAMLLDLQRYAATAWRADRARTTCPYLPSNWRSQAWEALRIDGSVPAHWKTLKRARGQVLNVHGSRASSGSSTRRLEK